MEKNEARQKHLDRLRGWRNHGEKDVSMDFLKDFLKQEVERPYKQLHEIAEVWEKLVPAPVVKNTRLESLGRGVLRVVVGSSATLYELDRLLRSGLEREIIRAHKGPAFGKISLRVGRIAGDRNPRE
jgi:hypothetical protein